MPALIFGALVLVLALWALNTITKVDPRIAARVTKIGGGLLSLGLAVFLGLRGEIGIAIPLGAFGLGLLGWVPFGPAGFSARTQKTGSQTSRVRSAHFEMDLDIETLIAMLGEVDDESRALLVAYLDRRDPAWSEHAQANAAAGRRATAGGKMSEQEAYQILGLEPGASANEIARAHRTLMKKLHPDQGGSTYLAARINEAKEILLRRHRCVSPLPRPS